MGLCLYLFAVKTKNFLVVMLTIVSEFAKFAKIKPVRWRIYKPFDLNNLQYLVQILIKILHREFMWIKKITAALGINYKPDRFTTCFKTCGTNPWVFSERF